MGTILIFEIDKAIADSIREILEEKDYKVTLAVSVHDFIDKTERYKPEIVLSDLRAHLGFNYEGMIYRIKEFSINTKIIVTTSLDEEEPIQRAIKAGAVACISKPFRADELEKIIKDAIDGKLSDLNG